jgi:hypothetical protein
MLLSFAYLAFSAVLQLLVSGAHTDSPLRQELQPVPTRGLARDIAESFLERAHVISGPSEIERLTQDDDGWIVEHTRGSFVIDRRSGQIHTRRQRDT